MNNLPTVNNPKRIQSLQRAMAVIEAIAASEDGMRLQALAQAVDLTPGAVHHIVDTLVAGGWLVHETKPVRYRLGPVLLAMGKPQQDRRLHTVVGEEMVTLIRGLKGAVRSIAYCEAVGTELRLTHMVEADRPNQIVPVANTVLPPYASAASAVHLAFWPAERVQAYREERFFAVHGVGMWGDVSAFDAAIVRTRATGYLELPLGDPTSLRIGIPVLGANGALVASLTLTARVTDPEQTRAAIIAAGTATTTRIHQRLQGVLR